MVCWKSRMIFPESFGWCLKLPRLISGWYISSLGSLKEHHISVASWFHSQTRCSRQYVELFYPYMPPKNNYKATYKKTDVDPPTASGPSRKASFSWSFLDHDSLGETQMAIWGCIIPFSVTPKWKIDILMDIYIYIYGILMHIKGYIYIGDILMFLVSWLYIPLYIHEYPIENWWFFIPFLWLSHMFAG